MNARISVQKKAPIGAKSIFFSRDFRESRDSREAPDCGKQGECDQFLEILEKLEILAGSRSSSSEKAPSVMTPFSGPDIQDGNGEIVL